MILLDSNVLVAAAYETHLHFGPSSALVSAASPASTIVAVHSLAEMFNTMTRPNRPYRLSGQEAWAIIDSIGARFPVVTLTTAQTLDAVRRFSSLGSGPRVYDYLIAATAKAHGADTLVTWNTRDFDGLFPALRIVTPEALV